MSYSDWREHFTKPAPRKFQDIALDKIGAALDDGAQFIVAEVPVGVGKSDIAMTLSKCTDSSYIATSLNVLVDQYNNDFKDDVLFKHVKGAKNYDCEEYVNCRIGIDRGCSCSKEPKDGTLDTDSPCPYKKQRNRAIMSKIALTNLTYFAVALPNSLHWQSRGLAVLDESHNLPNEILNLVSLTITNKFLRDIQCGYSILENTFFKKEYKKDEPVNNEEFVILLETLKDDCKQFIEDNADKMDKKAVVTMEDASDMLRRIPQFIDSYNEDVEWLVTIDKYTSRDKVEHISLSARPLYAGWFAMNRFFRNQAKQYLMQSATIIDPVMYMKELDITGSPYINVGSPFNVNKSRPVFCMNSGLMTYKEISNSMLKVIKDIDLIMACYKGKRGIVHTVSYDLQNKFYEAFKNNKRCIFMNNLNKEEMIKVFDESDDGVLFSPALTEGFDGKGDRLRFQILAKIPYPSLSDLRVKIKSERDRNWYIYETKKPIIQATGRGMRAEDDWCDFYVLDSSFERFNEQNMPRDFKDTVVPGRDAALTRASKIFKNLV